MVSKGSQPISTFYTDWTMSNKSVRANTVNKKYTHYCPIPDFIIICNQVIAKLESQKTFRPLEIEKQLIGVTLPNGNVYQKVAHSYKITMALFVLIKEKFLCKESFGHYAKSENYSKIKNFLDKMNDTYIAYLKGKSNVKA